MKREPRPWFPFVADEWLTSRHVRRLSLAERGAFVELLCHQWRDGKIATEPEDLAGYLGVTEEDAVAYWKHLGRHFPDGMNPVLELKRQEADKVSRELAARGKRGAEKRWQRDGPAITKDARAMANDGYRQGHGQRQREIQDSGGPSVDNSLAPKAPPVMEPDSGPDRPRDVTSLLDLIGSPVAARPTKPQRTPEEARLDGLATRAIARIRLLEAEQKDPFDPGKWWQRFRRVPIQARLETLLLLGRKLEAGDRPLKPWGYCKDTLREKWANLNADRAEAESESRRRANGRMEPTIA